MEDHDEYPELTVKMKDKEFKTVDYGWEDKTFVAVDKETGIEYRFENAWLSGYSSIQKEEPTGELPNLLEICKQKMINNMEWISGHNLLYELPFETLPKTKDEIVQDEDEEVDFENAEIIDLNEKYISLYACGDWQVAISFTATIKADGKLYYDKDSVKDNVDLDELKILTTQELIMKIFGEEQPKELADKTIDTD